MAVIKGNFENIYFGRLYWDFETESHFQNLKDLGIKHICNLLPQDESIDEEEDNGFLVIKLPIKDYDIPYNTNEFIKTLKRVNEISQEEKIFIHCFGGKGRTSIVVALLLILQGLGIDDSLKEIKEKIKGPETKEQLEFIKSTARLLTLSRPML